MKKFITSYSLDDEGTLHTYIGDTKHITISNVDSIQQAELLIEEENVNLMLNICDLIGLLNEEEHKLLNKILAEYKVTYKNGLEAYRKENRIYTNLLIKLKIKK